MKRKVLFVSNTANFSKFNLPYMKWFRDQGVEVHYASAGEELVRNCDRSFKIKMSRNPYALDNVLALVQLWRLVWRNNYGAVHCHTPVGGILARLAVAFSRSRSTAVFYTAHGFHFFRGAPLQSWLVYFPLEKLLSYVTHGLVTLNREDFLAARRFRFGARAIYKMDGVGVNLDRFQPLDLGRRNELRRQNGFSESEFVITYVGEFIQRKNHRLLVAGLRNLSNQIPNLRLVLVGQGPTRSDIIKSVSELGLSDHVSFLGYRLDVDELFGLSDLLVSTSRQEGLPINVVEGMACGLPVVATRIRGHVDLVEEGRNGFLVDPDSTAELVSGIEALAKNPALRGQMGTESHILSKKYSTDVALAEMVKIYRRHAIF